MKFARHVRGVTMLEMLVVIALVVLLLGFAIPVVGRVNESRLLTHAAGVLSEELNLARVEALTYRQPVEICLIATNDPPEFRAVQIRNLKPDGTYRWSSRRKSFGAQVCLSIPFSNVLNTQALSTLDTVPSEVRGVALRFYPNGRVERVDADAAPLPPTAAYLYLTVIRARTPAEAEAEQLPANFSTVQINPRSGRVTEYAP